MNVQLTSEMRELTAGELDAVSGGLTTEFEHPISALDIVRGVVIGCLGNVIMGIIHDIFD